MISASSSLVMIISYPASPSRIIGLLKAKFFAGLREKLFDHDDTTSLCQSKHPMQ